MTGKDALHKLRANVKVINTMQKIHDDLENFHRRKVLCKEVLQSKIKKQLETSRGPQSVVVPHGLQVNQVLHVPKPLQCCLHAPFNSDDLYVAHYGAGPENGICMWSKSSDGRVKRTKKNLNCRITNMVFVTNGSVYFTSCDDLTLRVFNNKFREQSVLQLNYSILSMLHDEKRCFVITGSVGAIQQWKLPICIHNPPILVRTLILEDNVSGITPWISFLHCNKEQDRFSALTSTALFIIDGERFEQVSFVENRHSFPLTVCHTYVPRQYLITGAKNGDIKVWNMSMPSFPYVGCFKGHLRKIITILTHPNEPLLVTASADSTIRFWRIETFQETYRFDVLDAINEMFIVGARKLYYTSPRYLCLLDFNYFHSIFTLVGAKCISAERIAPGGGKPSRITIVGDDGGVRIISPTHGNILTMLFPVVTHKPLAYTHDALEHMIYILLEDGGVMVISTKTNPCKTVQLWKAKFDDDRTVCCGLVFLEIQNETKSLLFGARSDGRISLLKARGLSMKTAAPSRGIITQFQANTVANSLADFLTYNTENSFTLWKVKQLGNGNINLSMIDDVQLDEPPSHITFRGNIVGLTYGNTLLLVELIFQRRGYCKVRFHRHVKDESHNGTITQLQSCTLLPIFATASIDGRIKIWDLRCELLRELVFDQTMSGLCFANSRGDLLVGFQSDVHFVPLTEYLPNYLLEMLLTDDVTDDRTEYCISFDPLLKFWYDPDRISSISLNETNNNNRDIKEDDTSSSHVSGQTYRELSTSNLDYWDRKEPSYQKLHSQGATPDFNNAKKPWHCMTPEELRNCRKNSLIASASPYTIGIKSLPPSSLAQWDEIAETPELPISEALVSEIMTILSGEQLDGQHEGSHLEMIKKYWPCAPDGFIPNSIIRHLITPKETQLDKVKPWQLKPCDGVLVEKEEGPQFDFDDVDDDDEFSNGIRTWRSNEEEEEFDMEDGFSFGSRRRKSFQSKKTNQQNKSHASKRRPTKNKIVQPKKVIAKLGPNPQTKKLQFKEKIKLKEEDEEDDDGEELMKYQPVITVKKQSLIPPPFDRHRDKPWFPQGTRFDARSILLDLIPKLDPQQPFVLKEILNFLVEVHTVITIPGDLMAILLENLLTLLDHESGQVRHYIVKVLIALGETPKSVIMKLVVKLDDPVVAVREEIKTALKKCAGIVDADALITTLTGLGEYKETELSDDAKVLENFRDRIVQRRDTFMSNVINSPNKDSKLLAWLRRVNQEIEEIRSRKKEDIETKKREKKEERKSKKAEEKLLREKEKLKEKVIKDWGSLLKKNNKPTYQTEFKKLSPRVKSSAEAGENIPGEEIGNIMEAGAINDGTGGVDAVGGHRNVRETTEGKVSPSVLQAIDILSTSPEQLIGGTTNQNQAELSNSKKTIATGVTNKDKNKHLSPSTAHVTRSNLKEQSSDTDYKSSLLELRMLNKYMVEKGEV